MSCQFPGCSKTVFPGSAYCSRGHRDAAPAPAPPAQRGGFINYLFPAAGGGSTENRCQIPGCSKPVYPGSQYCSRSHRDIAKSYNAEMAGTSKQQTRHSQPENTFFYNSDIDDQSTQKHRRKSYSMAPQPPYDSTYKPSKSHQIIRFYDRGKKYYEFTNFSDHPVRYNMKDYPTSEHLFQSLKFTDVRDIESIRLQPNPRSAFDEAHRLRDRVRKDWISGGINIRMMEKVLLLKFTQHERLKDMLLGTGTAILVEDSPIDPFWGVGSDGKGSNELGKALEKVRRILSEADRM